MPVQNPYKFLGAPIQDGPHYDSPSENDMDHNGSLYTSIGRYIQMHALNHDQIKRLQWDRSLIAHNDDCAYFDQTVLPVHQAWVEWELNHCHAPLKEQYKSKSWVKTLAHRIVEAL